MKVNSTTLSDFKQGRKIWLENINPRDRVHIKRHLRAIGELEPREVSYTTFREYGKSPMQDTIRYLQAGNSILKGLPFHGQQESRLHRPGVSPQITHVWFDEASRFAQPTMLYERPNGGQRTLPSVYGRLRGNEWMRANRAMQPIDEMNDGHLENTLKLLMESHGNIQAKTTTLLGKMWHHYQNQPEIQHRLEELCLLMQKVEVHEMYPIFSTLAQEQASRRPKTSVAFDDAVRNW